MFILVLVNLFGFVSEVQAAVSISEVAWMGSTDSANFEWIELVNESTSGASVTGWTLSDGMNLIIPLSGTIPGETYVLLERNRSDGLYRTTPPFVTYSGALVNTGATLTLRDSSGMIIDQVVGGENWEQIGGDNTTKETAQYTDAGWVTAVATPGQPNALTGRTPGTDSVTQSKTTTTNNSNTTSDTKKTTTPPVTVTQENTDEALVLTPTVPAIAYVGQPLTLTVEPSGLQNTTILNSLQYRWNFGDSYARGGKTVSHTYQYPGQYVISVAGEFASRKQQARTTITILPVQLSITRSEHGDIQVHNNAPYEISLDGFQVRGVKTVELPAETVLLPRATITIARHRLEVTPSTPVIVYDARGRVVTSTLATPTEELVLTSMIAVPPTSADYLTGVSIDWIPVAAAQASTVNSEVVKATYQEEQPVLVPLTSSPTPRVPERTFVGLVGILLVAIIALYIVKPRSATFG
jgi:hypothetical protein